MLVLVCLGCGAGKTIYLYLEEIMFTCFFRCTLLLITFTVKWFRLVLFAIFFICFIAGSSFARNTSLSGEVIDAETETPLVDVHVSLLRDREDTSLFRTGRTGQFRFDEIAPGTYMLRFERAGYEALDQEIIVETDPMTMTVKLERNPLELGEVIVKPGDEEHAHFEKTTDLEPFSAGAGSENGSDYSRDA